MEPLNLVRKYMRAFFGEEPLELLFDLFADDLQFSGPFYSFENAKDYIESLKKDPANKAQYNLIAEYQDSNSVCLIYDFIKPGVKTLMAQRFEINNEKISKIDLVFDTKAFS